MPRNILITGTSSGIGLAASVELARRGERVFASMRDLSRGRGLLEACTSAGVEVTTVQLDVTDGASVRRATTEVLDAAGHIDVLVNNAGVALTGPLELATEEDALFMFETHVFGPLRLARAVLPQMRERGTGRIVNISSGASHARMGHRLMGLYTASKAALSTLTEELLMELAPFGIDVVLIDGGAIGNTRMVTELKGLARNRDIPDSPYALQERMFQFQWPAEYAPGSDGWLGFAAANLADACTVADPPFIYPPEMQSWLEPALRMTDEHFVRLCKLDQSPELYEDVAGFWEANRTIAESAAST